MLGRDKDGRPGNSARGRTKVGMGRAVANGESVDYFRGRPKRAVVLAGSVGTAGLPLANYRPKLAFDLAGKSLFEHQFAALESAGIERVAVVSASHHEALKELVDEVSAAAGDGIHGCFQAEDDPRGTAGVLADLEDFLGQEPFLVVASHLFLRGDELAELFAAYERSPAAATVALQQGEHEGSLLEQVRLDAAGQVEQILTYHYSGARSSTTSGVFLIDDLVGEKSKPLHSVGLYIFEPRVLEFVPSRGYLDIKEQLLPRLRGSGLAVNGTQLSRPVERLDRFRSYFDLNRQVVRERVVGQCGDPLGVVMEEGVEIAASAQIEGPVILGAGCVVGEGVRVTGPASFGAGCRVEEGATVRDSILSPGARVERGGSVEESFLDAGCTACASRPLRRNIMVDSVSLRGRLTLITSEHNPGFEYTFCGGWTQKVRQVQEWAFHATKRVVDVAVSSLLLLILAPLCALIAVLIKRDSPGPVCYSQRRCGLGGKKFAMHKFRSMVADAEQVHHELLERKDIDGPMFKMHRDPRVTRIGRFLRRTSLDELPQLLNVLKGEMSLVGPRPLIMEEMEFAPAWRDLRLRVKPGITGLWQVNGRDSIAFHDWIANDIRYVKEQSLWLDFRILLQTFKVLKVEKPKAVALATKGRAEVALR